MANVFSNTAATTAAVTNRIVTSANMKVGTYTIANASPVWAGGANITITHTTVTGTDTLGTITIAGTDLAGQSISEVLTPVADSTVTGNLVFRSVASATGAGWVINTGNDTIVIGVAAGNIVCGSGGILHAIVVNTTAAAAITVSDKRGTIATLKTSIAEGTFIYDVDFSGYLKIATTSTNDVTAIHSATLPLVYASA